MGSPPTPSSNAGSSSSSNMDAIKKKMQSMKVEKDNAMDRSDICEQAAKEAKIRASKAEEEVAELVKKSQQLEVELDKTKEELLATTQKLDEKEKALLAAELEVSSLNRHATVCSGIFLYQFTFLMAIYFVFTRR